MTEPTDIHSLKSLAPQSPVSCSLPVQLGQIVEKSTKSGKPFLELLFHDATGQLAVRAWSDHPEYDSLRELPAGGFHLLEASFADNPPYGVDARDWKLSALDRDAVDALLAGPPQVRELQEAAYAEIESLIQSLSDPRLLALCSAFLTEFGDRFRRCAAARTYHHARRGGLVEHVAQMMRAADALGRVYPALNRDLLLSGALLHDCGKLFETCMEEKGFSMPYQKMGELLGHIPLGIEMANSLFHKISTTENREAWKNLSPPTDDVRLHLLHLIGAHHGEYEFGSPVLPKTPEAVAIHHIDNLDAKLEMFSKGYETGTELSRHIVDRVRPLPGNLVRPLAKFQQAASHADSPPGLTTDEGALD